MPKDLLVFKSFEIADSDDIFFIINQGILTFFFFLKYIFIFILLMIALLTLTKLRGIYLYERYNKTDENENKLQKPRLILGITYLFLAIGIAFNFLIYFLLWINSYFLPPPLIFQLLDVVNLDFYDLERIKNPNKHKYEFERFIYLLFALASFEGFLHLVLTVWYLVNNNRNISNPRKVIHNLIWSLSVSIIFGFLTFAPFFLCIIW